MVNLNIHKMTQKERIPFLFVCVCVCMCMDAHTVWPSECVWVYVFYIYKDTMKISFLLSQILCIVYNGEFFAIQTIQ